MKQRVARAAAPAARLGPRLAATAAERAQPANRHGEGHDKPAPGVLVRQAQLRRHEAAVHALAQKGVAHAINDMVDRREVDGDLVGKTILRGHRAGGSADSAQRQVTKRFAIHNDPLTIGAASALVKAAHDAHEPCLCG